MIRFINLCGLLVVSFSLVSPLPQLQLRPLRATPQAGTPSTAVVLASAILVSGETKGPDETDTSEHD